MNKHSGLFTLLILHVCIALVLCANGYTKAYQGQDNTRSNNNLPNDAIHISDIQSLVFKPKFMTTFRRSRAFPQMKCTGGSAQHSGYEPETIYCQNKGSDGTQIIWKCEATMPKQYKLGKTLVVCEGYNRAGDDVVLKGSCGLEYELEYTHHRGQQQQQQHNNNNNNQRDFYYSEEEATGSRSSSTGFGTLLVIFIVLVLVFMCCLDKRPRTTRPVQPSTNPNYQNIYPSAPPMQEAYTSAPSYTSSTTTTSSSGPGFWTGAATGAAAGYLYGRNSSMSNNNNPSTRYRQDDSYHSRNDTYSSSSSSYNTSTNDDDDHTSTSYAGTASR